ncbi:hypothetical protein WJX79_002534 [Trebouxia sp. C0005]
MLPVEQQDRARGRHDSEDLAAPNAGMSSTLEHKRAVTQVVKSLGLQADLRARAVVLAAVDSTVGNSLRDLIQLNEDDPALKALVEEFLRGEGTGADVSDGIVSSLQAMTVKMDQLLSITSKVGHYEAKSEKAWTKVASTARAQAALGWLVLNANQLESSPSHPGSIAMVGDFNKHFFYPPPPSATNTLHSLQTVLKIQAKRTLDTENSRAKTAAHVKMTLRNLCNQLQANQAVILEGAEKKSDSGTGGQRDRSEEGHEMANCDQNEHGRASGAPYGTDRGDTGESQDSGDNEAAMGNVLGAALTCASEKFATDRTAQKVAAFQQSSSKLPPALNELERFIFTRLSAKLPVTDSYYNGLVAQNDALKEMIEPVSYSGADILAALIVAALHPEFEGTDEIVIAGQVDTLLYQIWQCMCKFDMDQADLQKAIEQLGTKMSNWGANFHGKVEYLLCYACAGPILQFCVLPRGSKIPRMLGSEMSMGTQAGRLRIIAVAIQAYQVIKAQRAHLPDHYFPLGWTDHTSLSSIEFFDGYVQKRVEYSQAWPKKRRLFMTQRPKNQAELKSLTKCVLSGVQDLHNAGYGHTDIRWQNIIQCGNSYRLIDLEFVCKLKQRPFTPTGYVRKARPDLYSHKVLYKVMTHEHTIAIKRLPPGAVTWGAKMRPTEW